MNLATDIIQEVTETGMDVFERAGSPMEPAIDKLVRDSFIWSHLAGDTVQRIKVAQRLLRH
jgi:hypothetical protein